MMSQDEKLKNARLLRKSLDDYRNGDLSLGGFVSDVESISESLSDAYWCDRVHQNWWILEQAYAVEVIDRSAEVLSEIANDQIQGALRDLEEIANELENPDNR